MIKHKLGQRDPVSFAITRRGFLISMAAAGAVFGFPRMSSAAINPEVADGLPIEALGKTFEPSLWYWIDAKGRVNVNIIRAEMGQHVGTAIARGCRRVLIKDCYA